MTSPLVGLKPQICCQKHVKNLSATAKLDLKSSESAETLILLFIEGAVIHTFSLSFIHSFIHSLPLPREDGSRSCHVIPMNY